MALGRIDHIDLTVDDLEKALDYFVKALGFKLLRRTEHAGASVEISSPAGDFFFDLHQRTDELYDAWRAGALDGPGPVCFNHIAFRVEDIDREFAELKDRGASFWQEKPFRHPVTGRKIADARDADGRFWIQLTEGE
jgi:catechol 2,3-dioxygenase-like lactoylglutathione lyase family enzyme